MLGYEIRIAGDFQDHIVLDLSFKGTLGDDNTDADYIIGIANELKKSLALLHKANIHSEKTCVKE